MIEFLIKNQLSWLETRGLIKFWTSIGKDIYKIIKVIFFNITGQIKDYLLSELKFGKRYEEILDFIQGKAEDLGE